MIYAESSTSSGIRYPCHKAVEDLKYKRDAIAAGAALTDTT